MKLVQLAANMLLIMTNAGQEYLFSYETLVAGYDPADISETENGYWYVSEKYSQTTTKHIRKYLQNLYDSPKTAKVEKYYAEVAQAAMM